MPIKSKACPPNLNIIYKQPQGLVPYSKNARVHSEAHIAQIADSIKHWGWTNPILIDGENGVIAGHGRLLAALKLKMAEVPTLELSGLSEADKRAYILADNKLALNAAWDTDMLALELGALSELGADLQLTGFTEDEIAALMADKTEGLTDPDEVPPEPAIPVSAPGDLWALGKHRLFCGDSTSADDVTKLLGEVEPHLMVTDPPYGVNYDPAWRIEAPTLTWNKRGGTAEGVVRNDDRSDWSDAWALFPGDVGYIWHSDVQSPVVAESLARNGFERRALIVWAKSNYPIGRGHYHHKHEPCWYVVRKGSTGHWAGDRKQTTLWEIDKPRKSETGHSTQKPVECMKRPIENNSSPGQAVYDPFLGSGTTIIAAEMTGRHCFGLEISPAYCDVIIQRWQNFTGKDAMLGDKTYAQLTAERKAA